MSVTDKVERDLCRLDHDGSLLLQDPDLWVLKVTQQGRGWEIKQRLDLEDDDEYVITFTADRQTVRDHIRAFHTNLELIDSL